MITLISLSLYVTNGYKMKLAMSTLTIEGFFSLYFFLHQLREGLIKVNEFLSLLLFNFVEF